MKIFQHENFTTYMWYLYVITYNIVDFWTARRIPTRKERQAGAGAKSGITYEESNCHES